MIKVKGLSVLFYITGSIILMIPALCNNYPFVYSDTGTYIISGWENYIPKDRPVFYGWFLRHISLQHSLWIPVFVQCFFTFFIIHTLFSHYTKIRSAKAFSLVMAMALVFLTGVGLFSGKLMPDIFTALVILSGFLLFFERPLTIVEKVLLSIVFYYGLMVHLSHLIMVILFIGSWLILMITVHRIDFRKVACSIRKKTLFLSLSLGSVFTVPVVSTIYDSKFQFSSGSHVFLMARMGESGILARYLKENCNDQEYRLCCFADEIPASATTFIWPPESVLYQTGGWDSSAREYKEILYTIYTTPRYWKWLGTDFLMGTLKQFFTFSPGIIAPHLNASAPFYAISVKMPHELSAYLISRQNLDTYRIDDVERRQTIMVLVSLGVLLFFLFSEGKYSRYQLFTNKEILFILAFMVLNAFVCGALANVLDRLQGRIIWILPLMAMMILINYLYDKNYFSLNNERI